MCPWAFFSPSKTSPPLAAVTRTAIFSHLPTLLLAFLGLPMHSLKCRPWTPTSDQCSTSSTRLGAWHTVGAQKHLVTEYSANLEFENCQQQQAVISLAQDALSPSTQSDTKLPYTVHQIVLTDKGPEQHQGLPGSLTSSILRQSSLPFSIPAVF